MIQHKKKTLLSYKSLSLTLEVVNYVFSGTLDPHICFIVLFRAQRVFDQELMEGAVLGRILKHCFLLLHEEVDHIVELHQHSAMRDREDVLLLPCL